MTMPNTHARPRLRPSSLPGWESVYVFGVIALFCFRLLFLLVPHRCADLHEAYGLLLIGALCGVYLVKRGVSDGLELRLLLAWAVWALLSRWLNRDFYLFIDKELLVFALLTLLLFTPGLTLDRERRPRLLRWITLIYAGFFVVVAVAGIFVALTNVSMQVSPENVWISIARYEMVVGLNALSSHRLVTAPRFYMAWSLLLISCFRARRWPGRILCLLGMLILHLGISLCFSRSTQICFSLSVGMLAFLLCYRRFHGSGVLLRICLPAVLFLAALLLAYNSFIPCVRLLSHLNLSVAPRFEALYDSLGQPLDPERFGIWHPDTGTADSGSTDSGTANSARPSVQMDPYTDTRSLIGNWTLTERTLIWQSIFPTVREKPSVFFYGQTSKYMMTLPNKYTNSLETKSHMHNAFFQAFVLTGFPGFLILVLWALSLLRKMLRCYFAPPDRYPIGTVLLVIPLSAMLLFNMVEVSIAPKLDYCAMVFYLLAGILIADLRDAEQKA